MKRYLPSVFCSVVLFCGWTAIKAKAQTASAEAQAHVAKARAVAYRPDQNGFMILRRKPAPIRFCRSIRSTTKHSTS